MRCPLKNRQDEYFKSIEREWYQKLYEDGFRDIEDTRNEKRPLKEWDFNFFRGSFCQTRYEARLKYYELAREFLLEFPFENRIHKEVWGLHCEGYTERQIAMQIKVYKKSMVHHVILKLSEIMKKKYL